MLARGKGGPVKTRRVVYIVTVSYTVEISGGAQPLGHRGGLVAGVVLRVFGVGAGVVGGAVEAELHRAGSFLNNYFRPEIKATNFINYEKES